MGLSRRDFLSLDPPALSSESLGILGSSLSQHPMDYPTQRREEIRAERASAASAYCRGGR